MPEDYCSLPRQCWTGREGYGVQHLWIRSRYLYKGQVYRVSANIHKLRPFPASPGAPPTLHDDAVLAFQLQALGQKGDKQVGTG